MATNRIFKPIDTAFAILFLLLIAVSGLNVVTAADMGVHRSPAALQVTGDLERFRSLDGYLTYSIEYLRRESLNRDAKKAILDVQLERIEHAINELGRSGLTVPGLTRLVEPYTHITEARSALATQGEDLDVVLAPGGILDRALQATQFVVRNNILRLGEEQSVATASLNGFNNQARRTALFFGLAAVLVFVPVRLMAGRAAARPIHELKAATRALAEERWNAAGLEVKPGDAVAELVVAFSTMAGKLQESRKRRVNTFHRTLSSLVQTIEAKDAYVSNHSRNVSKIAESLAGALELPEVEVQEITCAALLHDIGKIGVPDAIINKPGKLTAEEFGVIEQHPVTGDRIVEPLDGSEVLRPPVRHHHEHWDGSGYPDGLHGEEIPLSARIIQIADVFEALTSERSYRSKMSIEQAVNILRKEAGTVLDPRLVDTFISKVLPRVQDLLSEPADGPQASKTQRGGSTNREELQAAIVSTYPFGQPSA